MVEPRLARTTMEVYLAADLSVDTGNVIDLPIEVDQAERVSAHVKG